jgi:hypothetical protein
VPERDCFETTEQPELGIVGGDLTGSRTTFVVQNVTEIVDFLFPALLRFYVFQ